LTCARRILTHCVNSRFAEENAHRADAGALLGHRFRRALLLRDLLLRDLLLRDLLIDARAARLRAMTR
jgi:hypothetical protein